MITDILTWFRLISAAAFMLYGLWTLFTSTVGVFRLHYVLNRIHIASKCDTLGILLILSSLMIMTGFNANMLKMALLIVFLWLSNPVASHLIAHLEDATNPDIAKEVVIKHEDN